MFSLPCISNLCFWWFVLCQVSTLHADFHLILITCTRGWRYCLYSPGEKLRLRVDKSHSLDYIVGEQWDQTDDRPQALSYDLKQSILTILGFHIEFLYLLIFISDSHINTSHPFGVLCGHVQKIKTFISPDMHTPSWGPTKWHSAFFFHTVNRYPSRDLFNAIVFKFLRFLLVSSLFKMASKQRCWNAA